MQQDFFPNISDDSNIISIARNHPPKGWENVFQYADDELEDISEILEQDELKNGIYYPEKKYIFHTFNLVPLEKVKVVLVGKDPFAITDFNGIPVTNGLSFSVKKGVKIPNVLYNIYKELKNEFPKFQIPSHGDLTEWNKQGVLLLNTCLTARRHQPGSHKDLWLSFVKKVMNAILDYNPECIFVVWGKKNQKFRKMLGERATVLEAEEPVGYRTRQFFGCDHFNEINKILVSQEKTPIDWCCL